MGLLSDVAITRWNGLTRTWYENKGYIFTKYNDKFQVNVRDLPKSSDVLVKVSCDGDNCESDYPKLIKWNNYLLCVKDDGKYYCKSCSLKQFGSIKRIKTRLLKGNSFEQWCIDNNRQDILDLWDYELNNFKPSEVLYASDKNYWFKCPRKIHNSELKRISQLTNGKIIFRCKACNSFAQWGIDNLGEDFLEKYWDYNKNKTNPYSIDKTSHKKVWIICQSKDYHKSYELYCSSFVSGNRCSYCNSHSKVHILDSLGTLFPMSQIYWSNKNARTPFDYPPTSQKKVFWKCPDGIHDDFLRTVGNSSKYNFRCPICNFSKGELKIYEILNNSKLCFIQQKEFDGLVGLGNGNLSYDFYLPDYNILIEYQGEQHERPVDFKGFGDKYAKNTFKQQQEHDRRKREYAKQNNYNLLEIWYWDYDRIEEILVNILFPKEGSE